MNSQIKSGVSAVRRSPFQALTAILVIATTAFLATILAFVVYGSRQTIKYFETRPQVIAFLHTDADETKIEALKEKLEGDTRISGLKYISKDEAMGIYKNATKDNPLLGELVSPSIFPPSFEFSVNDLSFAEGLVEELKKEEIVETVGFTASLGGESTVNTVINRLKHISNTTQYVGIVGVAALLFTSLLVVVVVMSLRVVGKKTEIESLSFLGATQWFIQVPIMAEAAIYAILGTLLGWLSAGVLIMYATPSILKYFGEIPVVPKEVPSFFTFLIILFFGELIVGMIVALFGSVLAVRRALPRIR